MKMKSSHPQALVLRAPGINCDRETAYACRVVGFDTDLLHINALLQAPERLLDYTLLVIPGGFSYGDDLGAGTLLAKNLTIHLGERLQQFINEGRLVLGICNGFQVLVRAGLLPASLTDNASAQFECRWVRLQVEDGPCIFTRGIKHHIELPVAHGEGQFVLADPALLTSMLVRGQIPLVYTLDAGQATPSSGPPSFLSTIPYPYNPNGSTCNIAGVCNERGNVFGLMPHPERYVHALQHPQRRGSQDGYGDGLLIFKNAYEYAVRLNEQQSNFTSFPEHTSYAAGQSRGSAPWTPEPLNSPTYAASGVDIAAADSAKELMREAVLATQGPEVLAGMGAFAGVFEVRGIGQMHRPALVASTDGVGTKTLIAAQARRFDTIGCDLVNHSVNDLLTQGAKPLFFMDYLAMGKLDPVEAATIVRGVAAACQEVGCALLGGETAEMPDVYLQGAFDLAGTIVGIVEQDMLVGTRHSQESPASVICAGDVLLGLPSSGLHTNGYSLARRVFASYPLDTVFPELGEPLVDALLRPHRCYLREIQALWQHFAKAGDSGFAIKGIAHITGGGFEGNISRILPAGRQAVIETQNWAVPPLFQLVQRLGQVARQEMYRTLNMGIGMVLAVSPGTASLARQILPELLPVGYIRKGDGVVLDFS